LKVSVIVVNWKVRELLRECLRSLTADTTLAPQDWELFVVDNDSADGSVEMVREAFPQAQLIANKQNLGFGAANNQAAALAGGEYLLLLNPDTKVQDDAVRKLTALLDAQQDIGIVGPRLLNGDLTLQRWTAGAFLALTNAASHYLFLDRLLPRAMRPRPLYLDSDVQHDIDVDWVSGACMAIRRTAVSDGLFDPRFFMYAEDMELCHRVKGNGWRIAYTPSVSIVHYHGASLKQQEGESLLSALKGPRKFFLMTHGRTALYVLDTLALAGFLLRAIGFGIAAVLRPGRYANKAALSWRYVAMAKAVWGSR
jgi:N-acetylglucosaminyl-diphospho-decaprenol L-rhamnosyltransferase